MQCSTTFGVAVVLALASSIAGLRSAEACSCSVPVLVSPNDGDTGVPPNAVVVVRSPKPLALIGPLGPVDVQVDSLYSQSEGVAVQRATPTAALSAGQYQVNVDGVAVSSFEVGGGPDNSAPLAPAITNATASFTPRACATSCGDSYIALQLDVASSDEAAYYDVVLIPTDGATNERYERTLLGEALGDVHSLGGAECGTTPPPMTAGSAWQVSLVAHDIADNASPASTASFVVQGCAELACGTLVPDSCEPATGDPGDSEAVPGGSSDGCMASRDTSSYWLPITIILLLLGVRLRRTRHAQ